MIKILCKKRAIFDNLKLDFKIRKLKTRQSKHLNKQHQYTKYVYRKNYKLDP